MQIIISTITDIVFHHFMVVEKETEMVQTNQLTIKEVTSVCSLLKKDIGNLMLKFPKTK